MKNLNFNNENFEAEKIIKTDTNIIGQDANSNELFAFRGISDFSLFTVINEDGTSVEFDTVLTETDRITALENALMMLM